MLDTSDYTVEYRVHGASFCIASDQTRHAMKLVRDRMHAKYDIEPSEHCVIKRLRITSYWRLIACMTDQGVEDQLNGEMQLMMWSKVSMII